MSSKEQNMSDLCITRKPVEVYKEVDWIGGFEGLVAVSTHGNVVRLKTGKVLQLKPNKVTGYIQVSLSKKYVLVHRLIAHAFVRNPDPTTKTQIDHVNNIKSDNAVWNLRYVTPQENSRNRRKWSGTSSKYIGVSWHARNNKWQSRACVDFVQHTIGYYETEEEAAHARDDWVRVNGGTCWVFNFPS
jgi:hypothetical protein